MVRKTKRQAQETRQQVIDAARTVFHRWGVNRSSLDRVAQEAGLTRGAVYWHFKDKAELFLAVREEVLSPLIDEIESLVGSSRGADPLDGIEAALRRFFQILDGCPEVRAVLDTIVNRCEHVAEFADVRSQVDTPMTGILVKLESAYLAAAAKDALRPGLDAKLIALDTWAFASGLMYRLLADDAADEFRNHVSEMISLHMALRRVARTRYGTVE